MLDRLATRLKRVPMKSIAIFGLRDAMGMCYTFRRPNFCVMKHGGRKI